MKNLFSRKIMCLSLFMMCFVITRAQKPPFYQDIQHFKSIDSAAFPPAHAILFVGSSSFTKWKDVQDYFPGYTIINRGFGGSTFLDAIRYADDIIFPYQPRQILIYEGDNDLASSDKITPDSVLNRFRKLFRLVREKLPDVSIVFVSIKPSPSRQQLMPRMNKANQLIKKFLKKRKHTAFVDVYHQMLNSNGTPNKNIFGKDMLHMNADGYAIWKKMIQPYLLKN